MDSNDFAQETEIIMLDEPTTYLDMSYQLEVLEVLQKLNREKNITVVIVLHELNNACRFADNIVGFKKGKVICEGRPLDVINKENLKEIYGIEANLVISEDGKYPICMEYDLFKEGYMRNKNFIIIVIGQIISLFGNAIQRFSMSLYFLEFTGSTAAFQRY